MRDPGLRSHHGVELQVGLLVVISLLGLAAGVLWISGADVGADRVTYYAAGPDAARVTDGTRIYLRGVDVGAVSGVRLTPAGAVLAIEVATEPPLPRDSRARLHPSAFLGSGVVELVPGNAGALLQPGDTLPVETVDDLSAIAGNLGGQAEAVLAQARKLLSDETVERVHSSGEDLSATVAELRGLVESEREALARLIENLSVTSSRLAEATEGPELQRTVASIDSLTGRLSQASERLDASSRSLSSILDKVDRGEGSLGLLVNDTALYGRVNAALVNLEVASEEIALLTRDVRERPERYLKDLKFSVF